MDDLKRGFMQAAPRLVTLHGPGDEAACTELAQGLLSHPPVIAPKFFYDDIGCKLFEAICELPEYPLTRNERALLDELAPLLGREIGGGCTLIDLGAGNCAKAERLFTHLRPAHYVAVDVAAEFLGQSLTALQGRHPRLQTVGLIEDFARELVIPPWVPSVDRVFFYPGSSIGNFQPDAAKALLCQLNRHAGTSGRLVMGVDLVRDAGSLVAAYDDALGVTAAFNLNVLRRANQLLGADFDLSGWSHLARYDAQLQRMEMYLLCRRDTQVRWSGHRRVFREGDMISTEYSYKYRPDQVERLLREAGWQQTVVHTNPQKTFAVAVACA
jgi:L-histidine Nalpha-methyltransferase